MEQDELKTLQGLEKEAREILAFLKSEYTPAELQDRLSIVAGYNARTGEMLAEAECILAKQKGEVLDRLLESDPKMSANQQKVATEAKCAYAIMVCRLIERANRATVHGGEIGITQAYVEKENMSLTRKGY